jgi:hypothetical protein
MNQHDRRTTFLRRFGIACLAGLMVSMAGAAPATSRSSDQILETFKLFAPQASTRPVDERPVQRWVENKDEHNVDKRWQLQQLNPRMVIRLSSELYAVQNADGAWFAGSLFPAGDEKNGVIACGRQYGSIEAMKSAAAYSDLPKPPAGWTIRELARMPDRVTRVASDGAGRWLYALCCFGGDVYRVDADSGRLTLAVAAKTYVVPGENIIAGLTQDQQNRLYVVVNHKDTSTSIYQNQVTIFRSDPVGEVLPVSVVPWLHVTYPWGVDVFNHGVANIALGPDGMLYVASGSRTDSGETGNDSHIWRGGETPITACIWRLDPGSSKPKIEVFARGLRNPYGFCWDDRGQMVATDNGPNEDPPEELNVIEAGGHYGFPYQFSDWQKSPYANTSPTPPGLHLKLPIFNLGPAGGGAPDKPLATLDPHSCPTGIVYLADAFPEADRGSFLVPRFGPLLDKPKKGFDVLQVRLHRPREDGRIEAEITTFLEPVARPVDIHISGRNVYVCEFSRETTHIGDTLALPGRILLLQPMR